MSRPTAISTLAHLLPGFRRLATAPSRRRIAALPATTAVPLTHEPMGEAELRAYRIAARAENARWAAVIRALPRPDLLAAAVSLTAGTRSSAASINATLAGIAQTTSPPPPLSRRTGREGLEARIAEHRARAAAQAPADAQADEDAHFGRRVAEVMARVRHPDGPPTAIRSPR